MKKTLTPDQITVTRLPLPRVTDRARTGPVVADPDGSDGGDSDGTDK